MEPADYTPLASDAHAFINGMLSAEAERDFQRRLAHDADLSRRVAEVQAARKLLASYPAANPPADFDERIRARIRRVEMARGALAALRQAPLPWWKRVAMVGSGAIAAALVFAVVGTPGVLPRTASNNDSPTARLDNLPVLEVTEADILPVICDQYHRYREVARQVVFARGLDADAQRELLGAELRTSDLTGRTQRLGSLCAALPAEQRRDYLRFLESLAAACERVDSELVASRNERRDPDLAFIGDSFGAVTVPERLESNAGLQVSRGGPTLNLRPAIVTLSSGVNAELDHYARAREAFYSRDYVQAGQLFDSYLASYSGGKFRNAAMTSGLSAHVRSGDMRRAENLHRQIRIKEIELLKQVDSADLAALGRALADRTAQPDG